MVSVDDKHHVYLLWPKRLHTVFVAPPKFAIPTLPTLPTPTSSPPYLLPKQLQDLKTRGRKSAPISERPLRGVAILLVRSAAEVTESGKI